MAAHGGKGLSALSDLNDLVVNSGIYVFCNTLKLHNIRRGRFQTRPEFAINTTPVSRRPVNVKNRGNH